MLGLQVTNLDIWKQLIFNEEHIKQIQPWSQPLGKLHIPFGTELHTIHEMNMRKIHMYTGLYFKLPNLKEMKACTFAIFAFCLSSSTRSSKNTVTT